MFWKLLSKRQKETPSPTWLDSILATTKAWSLRVSGWLRRKTMTLSPARLKAWWLLLFVVFAGWNSWIIVEALQHPQPSIPARQLPLVKPIIPSVHSPVDLSSLAGIGKFRSWLDSLQADTTGRKIYDSILRQRPGLLDSLRETEKTYSIHH
jgi:hypothetical protein